MKLKWALALASLASLATSLTAQEPPTALPDNPPATFGDFAPVTAPEASAAPAAQSGGFLTGDRSFPNFIGWVSNPTKGLDPRALTQLWPVFGSAWTSSFGPLPSGNVQLYGAGISVALSERLEIGLNNGGYAVSHFRTTRDGWLDLGGFAQYTLIRDVDHQFLLSGGLQWIAPSGEAEVFQGHGPAELATYLTAGKEFGCFHVLSTLGYQFPAGSGDPNSNFLFGSLHLDRRTFGWLYPLVEFNYDYQVHHAQLDGFLAPRGFIDLGGVSAQINMITVAPGFNAVLIPNRLEFGAVYQTPIATARDFHLNEVVVKMILRY
jgi:hypothetical protein